MAGGAESKVAPVTLAFWVMKICATTVGETGGDLLSTTLDLGYAASSALLLALFGMALAAQLRAKRFRPALYWAVILATSTAGTTISDFMDRSLDLGYAAGAAILVTVLVAVLAAWRAKEGTISVSEVRSPRAELFYWAAILASNTLGTAVGDFLSDSSGLGYAGSNLLISGGLAIVIAARAAPVSRTALFWAAFVLTRPFGATMGDLLTKPPAHGGLGVGTLGSSALLLAVLGALVVASGRPSAPTAAGYHRSPGGDR